MIFKRIAVSPEGLRDWGDWGRAAIALGAEALMVRGAADAHYAVRCLRDLGATVIYNGPPPPPPGVAAVHRKSNAARERLPGVINGRTCHTLEEVVLAGDLYDYLLFGPVFPTRSHPGAQPAGLSALERVCQISKIPVFAIGGVNKQNEHLCFAAGAYGIAGIDAFLTGERPIP
jgi:hypothetical protein